MGPRFALGVDSLVGFEFGSGVAVELVKTDFGVGLGFVDKKRGKPYFADFTGISWRQRLQKGLGKNHIFTRALGQPDAGTKIVDATAGFGQDAVQMLSWGCEVVALERSKEVAAVLRDGVARALNEESVAPLFSKIRIVETDAREYLAKLSDKERPDVIYIDPMFDKPKKTAKSPKNMQLLQELLGEPSAADLEQLFDAALAAAKDRVVVKQPLKGRALKTSPTTSFKGQSIRYDVYVK